MPKAAQPSTPVHFDLHRRDHAHRRTSIPPYRAGEFDPMLARKPVTIPPGRFLMLAILSIVTLCATANLLYDTVQRYNDQIVNAILYALPFAAVAGLVLVARIVVLWRRNARRTMAYEALLKKQSGELVRDLDTLAGELLWQKHEDKLRRQGKPIPGPVVAKKALADDALPTLPAQPLRRSENSRASISRASMAAVSQSISRASMAAVSQSISGASIPVRR